MYTFYRSPKLFLSLAILKYVCVCLFVFYKTPDTHTLSLSTARTLLQGLVSGESGVSRQVLWVRDCRHLQVQPLIILRLRTSLALLHDAHPYRQVSKQKKLILPETSFLCVNPSKTHSRGLEIKREREWVVGWFLIRSCACASVHFWTFICKHLCKGSHPNVIKSSIRVFTGVHTHNVQELV